MQRRDESGGAYGEDPYGDAGHAYAYGYEYGGSVATDTGTMSWDSVELAHWTHSEYSTHATGTDPHATGTHPYVAGPYPTTPRATAPDAPPGTGHSAGTASPTAGQRNSGLAVQKAPGPTDRSVASAAPAATSGPTAAPARITSPTSTAAPAPLSTLTRKGRANGSSHRAVK
ncbi:hypothetical protein [Streptomyces mirabilis]|uniref:hypothetical protein n=1 Tax=Streptomyces mirabilis TaxID=68239 RepID=UPI0036515441